MKLSEFAQTLLLSENIEDKLLQTNIEFDEWNEFSLPVMPGRNARISFSDEQIKFPKKDSLKNDSSRAIAIHSFANHELLAIEMMAAALLVYPHRTEDEIKFKKGILKSLQDEQKHFTLYLRRMRELGVDFGDLPLNDFFWRQMKELKLPQHFVSLMSLTFESANLDFANYYKNIFKEYDDSVSANIMSVVLEDEISHVAFGAYWMNQWRNNEKLWDYYKSYLPYPITPARAKGIGFREEFRRSAKLDEEFIKNLAQYRDEFGITNRKNS